MRVKNFATVLAAGVSMFASAAVLADKDFGFDFDGVYILGGVGVAGVEESAFGGEDDYGLVSSADFAWRAGAGAWLTDNFAIEFNYIGMANQEDSKDHAELETRDMYFLDISGLGRCDFTEQLWGFARLGVAWAGMKRSVEFNEEFTHSINDDGGMGASLGIGAQYDFTDMIGLRLEASTIQALNNNDMYAATGNIVVNFGELM
jgi:opacity protein-like surface antigen